MKILFLSAVLFPVTLLAGQNSFVTLISSEVADYNSSVYSFREDKIGTKKPQLRFNATSGTKGYFDMEYPDEEGRIVDLGKKGCFNFYKVAPLITYVQNGKEAQWIEDVIKVYNILDSNERYAMISEGHCYFIHSKKLKFGGQNYSEVMGIFNVRKFVEKYGVTLTQVTSFNRN